MNLLLAATAAVALAVAGVGILRFWWRPICQVPPLAQLGFGFCAGCFLESLLFFLTYLFGLMFSRTLFVLPVILLVPLGALAMIGCKWTRPRFNLAGFLALLLVLLALALSWSRPVYGYDAVMMWGLKAKMALFARTWPATMFDPHTTAHTDYPPLVPSAQAFVFFWMNRFDDVASRVIFAAFFAAGAAILWWWLRTWPVGPRGIWLLWWCGLPVLMEQVKITYADLPLAVCLLVFFGAVASWLRDQQRHDWLRLAGLFGGIAFWVKQDALIGIGGGFLALIIITIIRKLPLRPIAMTILVTLIVASPWHVFVWGKHLPTDVGAASGDLVSRCGLIAQSFARYAFRQGNYAFFWPLLVVTVIFCGRRLRKTESLWLLLSVMIGAILVAGVYLCSRVDLDAQLKTSLERVLLNLFVPALLLTALLWKGSFARLRCVRWQKWAAVAAVLLVVGMVWTGLHRNSDEELVGFPVARSLAWLVAGAVAVIKFLRGTRRDKLRSAWRAAQVAIIVATFGLAGVAIGVYSREVGELRRRFGGKSLAEQHAQALDPVAADNLSRALRAFPPGTHVRLVPKRSIRHHEFYYEAFPKLVVDDSAEEVIDLSTPP
jgi:hypothetical protein